VGHGTPYALRLDRFDVGDPDTDDPGSARAQIAWLEGDAVAGQGSTYLGNPARFRGLQVQLLSYVPDVTLRGWDGEGRPLVLQQEGEDVETSGAVEILFATVDAQPQFFVPTQDLFLTLSFQAQCEGGRPALQITASRGTASGEQYSATLYESGDLSLANLRLAVTLAYRPVLRTDRHPGAGWALGASALALLTLAVAWVLPPQLVEIALSDDGESGITMRVATVPGAERQRWLQRFLRDLTGALANDA
jgi:hypothetical protein